MAERRRWRGIVIGTLLLGLVAASPAQATQPTAGARTLGDPLLPQIGNGGYDVDHYRIALDYDPGANVFNSAKTTIDATADAKLKEFSLDFQDLDVSSVRVDGRAADFSQVEATPDLSDIPEVTQPMKLVIQPHPSTRPKPGRDFTVEVRYSGEPHEITDPDTSIEGWIRACYPLNPPQTCDGAFVVNEPMGAQSWFPSNNYPTDKATFDTLITVPQAKTALGVGELASREDHGDGTSTWHWTEDDPTATYLTTATVGDFITTEVPPAPIDARFADNEVSSGEWNISDVAGTGTSVTRDNSHSAYSGSWSVAHHAGPSAGAGNLIARENWFQPDTAIEETDPVASRGQEVWFGTAVYINSADPHDFTAFLRLSDISGSPTGVIQAIFESSTDTFRVDLEDYGNGGASGVGNVTYYSGVSMPLDQWVFIEIGALLSDDPSIGWLELWIDGIQHSTRVTDRTLKLPEMRYRRVQVGLGNYNATVAGREATVWTDRSYIDTARLGPLQVQDFDLTPAVESDSAQALDKDKRKALTPVTESDAAQALTFNYRVDSMTENSTGRTLPLYNAIDSSATADQLTAINNSLAEAPAQLNFLSDTYGPYPFDSSGAVADRAAGVGYALEVQTKPHYSGGFTSGNPSINVGTQLHELAHMWWGNSATLQTWADIWFNEGWANWSEWYWDFAVNGADDPAAIFDDLYASTPAEDWEIAPAILDGDPANLFVFFPTYQRGAMTVQAYREIVGDATFFAFAQGMQAEFAYGNVSTEEFIEEAKEASGLDGAKLDLLDEFFQQWLYGEQKPTILPADFA